MVKMASDKQQSSKQSNASLYSTLSTIQYDAGCSFLGTLDLKLGYKVLDMGCGTGELTQYIANQVGDLGEVVGVDPDKARVKFAKENIKAVSNTISFHAGNSESGFPNAEHAYYDLHFSNHVYHWLSGEEKAVYVKLASQCLKPGGLIAIQCLAEPDDDIDNRLIQCAVGVSRSVHFAEESSQRELLSQCGFNNVDIAIIPSITYYKSFEVYAECFRAAAYKDINDLSDKALLEEFKLKSVQEDGRVQSKYNLIQIKGRKS